MEQGQLFLANKMKVVMMAIWRPFNLVRTIVSNIIGAGIGRENVALIVSVAIQDT